MKIKSGFVKREVMGKTAVIPTGTAGESVKGLIKLNETASFIWNEIEEGKEKTEIVSDMVKRYSVSEKEASDDFDALVRKMKEAGVFED